MDKMNLNEAMKFIVKEKGKGVLADSRMLNSMLHDLMGNDVKIISLVVNASQNHYFDVLANCNASQVSSVIEKTQDSMKKDYAESIIDEITDALNYAFALPSHKKPGPELVIPFQSNNNSTSNTNNPSNQKNGTNPFLALIGIAVIAGILMMNGNLFSSRSSASANIPSSAETSTSVPELTPEPTPESTPKPTPTPEPTPVATKETVRTGTVYISPKAAEPRRIIVRTSPMKASNNATNKRKYNGDRVTVYEITEDDDYTWYRIGEKQWIAGNGTSFYVIFD